MIKSSILGAGWCQHNREVESSSQRGSDNTLLSPPPPWSSLPSCNYSRGPSLSFRGNCFPLFQQFPFPLWYHFWGAMTPWHTGHNAGLTISSYGLPCLSWSHPWTFGFGLQGNCTILWWSCGWDVADAIEQVRESSRWQVRERQIIVTLAEKRWKQMCTSLHGAAFALYPQYQMHAQSQNPEIINNFEDICKKLLSGDQCNVHINDK